MELEFLSPEQKALNINLNSAIYGTFAEIGAGQEVARCFFRVGGAAGTVAKSMSAYDMKFSDDIYGKASRYVSRDRLMSMLEHEYGLLLERLTDQRGASTTFFAFANTVSARNFKGTNECHGWMGIRFQISPMQPSHDIVLHVRMIDKENIQQQQAIGIVGVNLIYGAYYYRNDLEKFVSSLLDALSVERIEIDMLQVSGPSFSSIDNRSISLKLLQHGLTKAVMFGSERTVYQPSEVLYKRALLIERGSFRPITHVNVDMISCAQEQVRKDASFQDKEILTILEITLSNLLASGSIDENDFLDRVDSVSALGYKVLVTNYSEFFRLPAYLRRHTHEPIAIVLGINHLIEIFNERYYEQLEGGILEAFGRLFRNNVRLLIYPMSLKGYERYVDSDRVSSETLNNDGSVVIKVENVLLPIHQRHLLEYLVKNRHIENLNGANRSYLDIFSREILQMIKEGNVEWEKHVPAAAASVIKERGLFRH